MQGFFFYIFFMTKYNEAISLKTESWGNLNNDSIIDLTGFKRKI